MHIYSQNTILNAAVCIHFISSSAYPNPKHNHIYEFHDPNVFDNYQKTPIFLLEDYHSHCPVDMLMLNHLLERMRHSAAGLSCYLLLALCGDI